MALFLRNKMRAPIKVDQSNKLWFMDIVNDTEHVSRIMEVENIKEYLLGKHDILNRPNMSLPDNKVFETSKIVINTLKSVIDAHTAYVISNPVSLTGDNDIVTEFNKVYRRGNFNRIDIEIADSLYRYGNAWEYIYQKDGKILSKLIPNEEAFPVYDDHYNYVNFIQSWRDSLMGDEFHIVYCPSKVEEYKNGILVNEYANLTNLPIHYKSLNRSVYSFFGRGIAPDLIKLMDYIEKLLSKMDDSITKYALNPISTLTGQIQKDSVPVDMVGTVLNLEEGAEYKPVVIPIDQVYSSMKLLLDNLMAQFYNMACVPSSIMGGEQPQNISEVSLKMLYSLQDNLAKQTMQALREGMYQRFEYIRKLLEISEKPVKFTDDEFYGLNVNFNINRPTNEIDKLKVMETQYNMKSISKRTIIENSPIATDVSLEIKRIEEEQGTPKKGDNILQET